MILAAAAERPVLDAIIKTKTEAEQRLREAGFEEVDTAVSDLHVLLVLKSPAW